MKKQKILITDITVSPFCGEAEVFDLAATVLRRSGLGLQWENFSVYRRSIDARRKDKIRLVYSVCALCRMPDGVDDAALAAHRLSRLPDTSVTFDKGTEKLSARPVIVGMGPAGLFSALLLAENGYRPILLERGDDADARLRAKERFYETNRLDPDSNIQFGAGGAGTFSDGKLVTRINDRICAFVLERLCALGAPADILTKARPHIGTDILLSVVKAADKAIRCAGGDIRYRTKMTDIKTRSDGTVERVLLSDGETLPCGALILAPGHSARDTYAMLMSHGVLLEAKNFSVGVRIEHLREDIDRAMYGKIAEDGRLGAAEYSLSCHTKTRGVYTFCMCPGGEVVAAASENGGVVVNGMSEHERSGRNSNSAVAVSVFREDYGGTPDKAIAFQRQIEQTAYRVGGGDFRAPISLVGDFLQGTCGKVPKRVLPTYMEGNHVALCDLRSVLPPFVSASLCDALRVFDRTLPGFAAPDAVLTAPETRTSSPVRILRGEQRTAPGFGNLYPCGEGAGYAGGITSAAVDGIRTAISLMERFAPPCEESTGLF